MQLSSFPCLTLALLGSFFFQFTTPQTCPPARRCPIISPPPAPLPLVPHVRPRPPLYPPTLNLMPSRPSTNPGPLSERARILFITQELKRNITSDPFNYTATWVGNNYCLFRGYYCDTVPDKNITGLSGIDFNRARFGGNLNFYRYIMNLPDIAIFHVNSNNFSGVIGPGLGTLRYLYELDLSNNGFTGGFPGNALQATKLSYFDFRFNKLAGSVPTKLFDFDTDVLFINNNGFSQAIPTNFGNTPALYLTLANNKFSGTIPRSIGRAWNTLTEVLFLGNKLKGCLPFEIGYLNKSTVFDAGSNGLTGPIPQSFGCMKNLQFLNLAHNRLYGTVPEVLCRLPNAFNFTLSNNYFTQVGPECRKLIRTRRLNVNRNCIMGLPFQRSVADCSRFFSRPRACARESSFSILPCTPPPSSLRTAVVSQEEEVVPVPRSYRSLAKPPH